MGVTKTEINSESPRNVPLCMHHLAQAGVQDGKYQQTSGAELNGNASCMASPG